jgi:hypothetical protein
MEYFYFTSFNLSQKYAIGLPSLLKLISGFVKLQKSKNIISGFVKLQKLLEPKLDIILYFTIAHNTQVHK